MNELVNKLIEKEHKVSINYPNKLAKGLRERIELNLVYVLLEETNTELGLFLDKKRCDFSQTDFAKGMGEVYLEGVLTLNGEKVRCTVNANISTMKGMATIIEVNEEVYKQVLSF